MERVWMVVDQVDAQWYQNSSLEEVSGLVMEALRMWEKRHSCPPKEEKGELSLALMMMSGWKSKDYLAPTEESVLLVEKSTGMPETTSGVLHPKLLGLVR